VLCLTIVNLLAALMKIRLFSADGANRRRGEG
jgi:hypothetical protein